jgi:MFS family permease
MVDVAEAQRLDDDASLVAESDFSPRKLKIATGILIGQSFATSILPFSAVGILLIPLTTQFHWTRADYSLGTSFLFFFGALSLLPIGWAADRFGTKPVILFGTTIVGLITLAMSTQTKSLTQLYIYYSLLGVFGSTGVAYSKMIAGLFTQNRGKAMAILGAESTLAMAFVPLMANFLMLNFGWRVMYLAFGALVLVIVPILYFLLEEPVPPNAKSVPTADGAALPQVEGMSIWEALSDRVFWLITLNALLGLAVFVGMAPHMVAALIGKGFSQTTAVGMTSVAQIIGIGGTLLGGYLVDRVQTAKIAVPFTLASALGAVLLLNVTSSSGGFPVLATAIALGGFAFAAARPMGTYFQTRFFGLRSFTTILSVQFFFTNVITAYSPRLMGQIYDQTHSYRISFIMMIAAPLFSTLIWLILPKYRYSANIGQTMVQSKD